MPSIPRVGVPEPSSDKIQRIPRSITYCKSQNCNTQEHRDHEEQSSNYVADEAYQRLPLSAKLSSHCAINVCVRFAFALHSSLRRPTKRASVSGKTSPEPAWARSGVLWEGINRVQTQTFNLREMKMSNKSLKYVVQGIALALLIYVTASSAVPMLFTNTYAQGDRAVSVTLDSPHRWQHR